MINVWLIAITNVWWNYSIIYSVLKNYAAYINKLTVNNSPYNTRLFKYGDSEISLPFESYGLFY